MRRTSRLLAATTSLFCLSLTTIAQAPPTQSPAQPPASPYHQPDAAQLAGIAKDNSRHFGDDPDNPGPLATDLSPALNHAAVEKAMRKVADWQLARSQPYFDRIWTWSVLYSGFIAASSSLHDPTYRDAMQKMSEGFHYELRSKMPDADDQSVGQTYVELALEDRAKSGGHESLADNPMVKPTREALDRVMNTPYKPASEVKSIPWWWCDALFMAPPLWARMYAATGDRKYITYLDDQWKQTYDLLWNPQEDLYARDSSYKTRTEGNGQLMFWSRGEGWVMGGLARTIPYLPKDDARRAFYVKNLQQMSASLAKLQGADGLWRPGMKDPTAWAEPEISGSTLIVFGLAYGVNEGYLDAKVYRPIITRAWAGIVKHIYADGRLADIQQTGPEPAPYKASASYTYGVGGFLLAGSELLRMDEHTGGKHGSKTVRHTAKPSTR
jgi:unsaturated rhamnogalacturonyl hydrolase